MRRIVPLRRWWPLIPLGALALYYALIPVIGPHYAEVCSYTEKGEPYGCRQWDSLTALVFNALGLLDRHNGIVAALSGVAVAFFTAVLWRSTDKLWTASREQIRLQQDEFNATHRPTLIVREVYFEIKDDERTIAFTLANVGDVAAVVVESAMSTESVGDGEVARNIRPEGRNELGRITLGPGEYADRTLAPSHGDRLLMLPGEAYRTMFVAGSAHFLGTIVYADPTGRRRRMVFQRRHIRDADTFEPLGNPNTEYSD